LLCFVFSNKTTKHTRLSFEWFYLSVVIVAAVAKMHKIMNVFHLKMKMRNWMFCCSVKSLSRSLIWQEIKSNTTNRQTNQVTFWEATKRKYFFRLFGKSCPQPRFCFPMNHLESGEWIFLELFGSWECCCMSILQHDCQKNQNKVFKLIATKIKYLNIRKKWIDFWNMIWSYLVIKIQQSFKKS